MIKHKDIPGVRLTEDYTDDLDMSHKYKKVKSPEIKTELSMWKRLKRWTQHKAFKAVVGYVRDKINVSARADLIRGGSAVQVTIIASVGDEIILDIGRTVKL